MPVLLSSVTLPDPLPSIGTIVSFSFDSHGLTLIVVPFWWDKRAERFFLPLSFYISNSLNSKHNVHDSLSKA